MLLGCASSVFLGRMLKKQIEMLVKNFQKIPQKLNKKRELSL